MPDAASFSIAFDRGPQKRPARFSDPLRVLRADAPEEIAACLAAVDLARRDGHWVAGFLSYELGYALVGRLCPLMPGGRRLPLAWFLVCDAPASPPAPSLSQGLRPLRFAPAVSRADYGRAFDRAKAYIAAGECYQVNLTFPLTAPADDADPRALYAALAAAQPVDFGCLVEGGDFALLSRSPELFFQVDAEGRAETRPMKGTAARDPDPARDRAVAQALGRSVKDRAENLMIVDLLRNDLSRIARPGSVAVPRLFEVETYATLHQMTSTVTARLRPGLGFAEIVAALFPCGSITGAPKIRAMQIIRELEPSPRDAYCGAIGWIAPSGEMRFSVAIRTLILQGGTAVLNVGGGIVQDSRCDAEWEEALCKAAFATTPRRG